MTRPTLLTTWLLCTITQAAQTSRAGHITVPVRTESGTIVGNFDVGNSRGLSLGISTEADFIYINAGVYRPSNRSKIYHESQDALGTGLFGNLCETDNITYTSRRDVMAIQGLQSQDQLFNYILPNTAAENNATTKFSHDGVVGLGRATAKPGSELLVQNLCAQGQLRDCRFGLSLDGTGTGSLVLGGFNKEMAVGEHSTVGLLGNNSWTVGGSVQYSSGANKLQIFDNQKFFLATEMNSLIGPIEKVRTILESIEGSTIKEEQTACGKVIFGNYPCASRPPVFNLLFGGEQELPGPLIDSTWNSSAEGTICTAPIVGTDGTAVGNDTWFLGQPFLRGRYVDFDIGNRSITVARSQIAISPIGDGESSTIDVPLRFKDGGWVAQVGVGASQNLSLLLDTTSADLVILPSFYKPSPSAQNLHQNGTFYEAIPQGVACNGSTGYTLFKDDVSIQGFTILNQTVVNETGPKRSQCSGFLGLSGLDQRSLFLTTDSFIDNILDQNNSPEHRFGIALNSTTASFDDGTGTLVLGGIKEELINGSLSTVPIDFARKNRAVPFKYANAPGQWWLRGDIGIRGPDGGEMFLRSQSMYLDFSSSYMIGPLEDVKGLFKRANITAHESDASCPATVVGIYDCSSPPEIQVRFGGDDGVVISLSPLGINAGSNGNNSCTAAVMGEVMGDQPYWSFGSNWFLGKYIDFNGEINAVSFGHLKDGALPTQA